ncbi:MAG TPA: YceD family protein [Povalibacter sp.]
MTFAFSEFDDRVVIDGQLDGMVALTCQRCMSALELPVHETFKVMLVRDEAELDLEPGGYETMLADPARLDLQALAEDQILLALPLVPKHDSQCVGAVAENVVRNEEDDPKTQKPFGNLRDLMRGR